MESERPLEGKARRDRVYEMEHLLLLNSVLIHELAQS